MIASFALKYNIFFFTFLQKNLLNSFLSTLRLKYEFCLFVLGNISGVFVFIWLIIMASLVFSWVRNPLYKILNLILLSVFIVFMWSFYLDFTFILLCYIIAFTSAIVMLFLTVVLMLPVSYQANYSIFCLFQIVQLDKIEPVEVLFGSFYLGCAVLGAGVLLFLKNRDVYLKLNALGLKKRHLKKSIQNVLHAAETLGGRPKVLTTDSAFTGMRAIEILKNNNHVLRREKIEEEGKAFYPTHSGQGAGGLTVFIFRDDWRTISAVTAQFTREFLRLSLSILDGYLYASTEERHVAILKFTKKLYIKYGSDFRVLSFITKCEARYWLAHDDWNFVKFFYPTRGTRWKTPVIAISDNNFLVMKKLSPWSPYFIFVTFFQMIFTFLDWAARFGFFSLGFVKIKFFLEYLAQILVVCIIYITLIPFNLVFAENPVVSESVPLFENFKNENLVSLKHYLYEEAPIFALVAVNILLVALISVTLLKKNKP